MKYHVKKGDKVLVNSGNYKGEEATIKAVITKNDRVVRVHVEERSRDRQADDQKEQAQSERRTDRAFGIGACFERHSRCRGKDGVK